MYLTKRRGFHLENFAQWWVSVKIRALADLRIALYLLNTCCDRSQTLMACLSGPSIPCRRWLDHLWPRSHHHSVLQATSLTMLCFECEGDTLMEKSREIRPSHGVANKNRRWNPLGADCQSSAELQWCLQAKGARAVRLYLPVEDQWYLMLRTIKMPIG